MHPASYRRANVFCGLRKNDTMPIRLRGPHRVMTLVVASLILFITATAAAAFIVEYTVTQVIQSDLSGLPSSHWAHYATMCDTASSARKIKLSDSLNRIFERVNTTNVRFPFYAWNSTSWYVSSMGFLSPTPYGMCSSYCPPRFFADLRGTYAFSDNATVLYGGGGDWPMIGFYTMPFVMTEVNALKSFVLALESSDDSGVRTTVEYCNVPIRGATGSAQTQLTAQVVVYANGTIIMRYASLPDTSMLPEYMPSTGLVYSKTLRTVVPTPTAANGIVAYRFDPVLDACAAHGDASVCTADTGGDCVWCSSTSACCASTLASEVCPRGQWATPARSTAAFAPQKFYDVTVDFATPFVTMSSFNYVSTLENDSFPLHLEYPEQNIPLFHTPSESIMNCIPGASCPTQADSHPCGVYSSVCVNGNYTLAILALESSFSFRQAGLWVAQVLPERARGEQLCEEEEGCATGLVGHLTGVSFRNSYSFMPLFSVQLYADANGVIDITIQCASCEQGDPMLAYPPMRVGLVRYGVDDASSVMIPQGLLRSGLHVRFVPQSSCKDCGLNGWCDESSGRCQCQPGYYGRSCLACPACWTGSMCDEGIMGSGTCLCSGGACEAACANTSGGSVPSRSCGGCDAVGGRCNCGVCECRDGWSGAGCSEAPADACRAYSFDGCEVCGQHEGCVFCHDSTCFNPALSGTRDGYTCSYSTPAADRQACVTYGSRGLKPHVYNALDFIAIISLALSAPVIFSMLVIAAVVRRNRQTLNPMDAFSVVGAPGFRNLRREREVVQGALTRGRVPQREIMGIPLKQVSLRRLFKRRKEGVMSAQ
ncbi:conserved hypothetical protein [Leishmania mexicana MHOM/GT/2001/U1103]|uniref:EGF-like domain-containing protein n=1 Tax=Leishmania mexicana (strain MHOM/GT/2001/U1103) TaxID=929439 RepID=E9B253_LEIMU|nr:conserved hypothetical protein [Leishmania mexicana MHOM/GT/2001/U1103]CBZ29312.1 conserved hypothetical protein [Leishmania mexicana MHOM/GT/2001/U1103]